MFRKFILCALVLALGLFSQQVFAQDEQYDSQEEKAALTFFPPIGVFASAAQEVNGHSRTGFSYGGVQTIGVDLNKYFSAGSKVSFFLNFDTINSLETLFFFRYYLPWLHWPTSADGPFVQADLGAAILFETGFHENTEAFPFFSGGVSIGWRFNFLNSFYFEPAVRVGYPHIWGVSTAVGIKLKSSEQ